MPTRRRPVSVALLTVALITAAAACAARAPIPPPADLAIVHVNVVDVREGRVLRDRTVRISGETITSVAPATRGGEPHAVQVIDGSGAWLIPGLWDMHAHVRGNGLPEWITTEWMLPLLLAHGVTGVRDMTSDCEAPRQGPVCFDQVRAWQRSIEGGDLLAPRLLALSSFQINPAWGADVTEDQARALVGTLHARGVTNLKIYDRLPPDAFAWIMDEAAVLGLSAWGHVPLRITARAASDAGMRSIEHARDFLFDCYPGSEAFRRTARSTIAPVAQMRAMVDGHDSARCDTVFRTLRRNGTWYVPTHVTRRRDAFAGDSAFRNDPRARLLFPPMYQDWLRHADRMVAFDSAAGGATLLAFYRKGLEITGAAHRAGVRILLGTDGGDAFVFPGSAVHDELAELVSAGLSPAEALRAATWSGAEFLGLADRHGSIEAGKRADLVLLDGDPLAGIANTRSIRAVFLGGVVLDRARLDDLLSRAEAAAGRPLEGMR